MQTEDKMQTGGELGIFYKFPPSHSHVIVLVDILMLKLAALPSSGFYPEISGFFEVVGIFLGFLFEKVNLGIFLGFFRKGIFL